METLTIGKLADKSGVGIETIRYYERRGLIPKPRRKESGYRRYSDDMAARIQFIRHAKDLGFSLKEIKELLSLKLTPGTPCSEVKKRAEAKILDIETKISSLQKMKKALVKLTKACSGSGCCIGPAVFIVSGTSLGFMGRLSFLSPYKNYLLGVAVIMLGYSFRRIYLKKSDCACKENIRVRKIERGIFWVGFAALVLSAIFSRIILWIYG